MKIVSPLYSISNIEEIAAVSDCVIVNYPRYSYIYDNDLNVDEAIKILSSKKKKIFIAINRIMHDEDLVEIRKILEKFKDFTFIVSDLGVVQLSIDMGIVDHVIYDPDTLITNKIDLGIYNEFGFKALAMSNEIPLKDVIDSYKEVGAHSFYQVFGSKLMFYSRRQLLSLFKEYSKGDFSEEFMLGKEEKRSYLVPIHQNENGTYVYRQYLISLLDEADSIRNLDYLYFESLNMDYDKYIEVIKIYREVLSSSISLEEGKEKLDSLTLVIEEGFTYKDTAYTKEEAFK